MMFLQSSPVSCKGPSLRNSPGFLPTVVISDYGDDLTCFSQFLDLNYIVDRKSPVRSMISCSKNVDTSAFTKTTATTASNVDYIDGNDLTSSLDTKTSLATTSVQKSPSHQPQPLKGVNLYSRPKATQSVDQQKNDTLLDSSFKKPMSANFAFSSQSTGLPGTTVLLKRNSIFTNLRFGKARQGKSPSPHESSDGEARSTKSVSIKEPRSDSPSGSGDFGTSSKQPKTAALTGQGTSWIDQFRPRSKSDSRNKPIFLSKSAKAGLVSAAAAPNELGPDGSHRLYAYTVMNTIPSCSEDETTPSPKGSSGALDPEGKGYKNKEPHDLPRDHYSTYHAGTGAGTSGTSRFRVSVTQGLYVDTGLSSAKNTSSAPPSAGRRSHVSPNQRKQTTNKSNPVASMMGRVRQATSRNRSTGDVPVEPVTTAVTNGQAPRSGSITTSVNGMIYANGLLQGEATLFPYSNGVLPSSARIQHPSGRQSFPLSSYAKGLANHVTPNGKPVIYVRRRTTSSIETTSDFNLNAIIEDMEQKEFINGGTPGSGLKFDKNQQRLSGQRSLDSSLDGPQTAIIYKGGPSCNFGLSNLQLIARQNLDVVSKELVYSEFMKAHKCYDLIPTSTKMVVFDTNLAVKKAFFALVYNGVRAAPLWDSSKQEFSGMLTITDFINILRKYYISSTGISQELEEHKISTWKDELAKDFPDHKQFVFIQPNDSLFSAVKTLCESKVHRLPIVDPISGNVLYVLTHKRILRFLYLYIFDLPKPPYMSQTPKELGIGTWNNVQSVNRSAPLIEALNKFCENRVSALPVLNDDGEVVDVYAKFDVINLAAEKSYNNLNMTVEEALKHRIDWFEGVNCCQESDTLASVIENIVKAEVHRLVVVDANKHPIGIFSLSDLLSFLIMKPVYEQSAKMDVG